MKMIYFIDCVPESVGWKGKPITKVGITEDIDCRIKSLSTGNPAKMELVARIESDNEKEIESNIQTRLMKFHVSGEWYKLPKGIITWAEKTTEIHSVGDDRLETLEHLVMGREPLSNESVR